MKKLAQQTSSYQLPAAHSLRAFAKYLIVALVAFELGIWTGTTFSPSATDCPPCSLSPMNWIPYSGSSRTTVTSAVNQSSDTDTKAEDKKSSGTGNNPMFQVIEAPRDGKGKKAKDGANLPKAPPPAFSPVLGNFMTHYGTIPRDEFNSMFDIGVPYDISASGSDEVLMLYNGAHVLPRNISDKQDNHTNFGSIGSLDPYTATAQCNEVKVVLLEPARYGRRWKRSCVALVPQWASFQVYRFLRAPPDGDSADSTDQLPLRFVSSNHDMEGEYYDVPHEDKIIPSLTDLKDYISSMSRYREELKEILQESHGKPRAKTSVVVLVCNWGQAQLLHNFICHGRAHGLEDDIRKHALVFATDEQTRHLAQDILNLTTYYSSGENSLFHNMPEHAAAQYADATFGRMMMAKTYVVQLVLSLGYSVLFQDVDILWFHNPLKFLESHFNEWDLIFQDDGQRGNRYQPTSPNTGFYYVRNNRKTKYLFYRLLKSGDAITQYRSHQFVLTSLMNDMTTNRGLKVKVISRDSYLMPGGFEYQRRPEFMKEWMLAKRPQSADGNSAMVEMPNRPDPLIFHMHWTENKNQKLEFLHQIGEWFVADHDTSTTAVGGACLVEPNVTCYYRDRPSLYPCRDSPSVSERPDAKSFW